MSVWCQSTLAGISKDLTRPISPTKLVNEPPYDWRVLDGSYYTGTAMRGATSRGTPEGKASGNQRHSATRQLPASCLMLLQIIRGITWLPVCPSATPRPESHLGIHYEIYQKAYKSRPVQTENMAKRVGY